MSAALIYRNIPRRIVASHEPETDWIRIHWCNAVFFRGKPAQIEWEVVDSSIEYVTITLRNKRWSYETNVGAKVRNTEKLEWKKVLYRVQSGANIFNRQQ